MDEDCVSSGLQKFRRRDYVAVASKAACSKVRRINGNNADFDTSWFLDEIAIVESVSASGNVAVRFEGDIRCTIEPGALLKMRDLWHGDLVKIVDDIRGDGNLKLEAESSFKSMILTTGDIWAVLGGSKMTQPYVTVELDGNRLRLSRLQVEFVARPICGKITIFLARTFAWPSREEELFEALQECMQDMCDVDVLSGRPQWYELCGEADGQLHRGGTWKLLRHLMDESKSKEYQRHRMAQILYTATKKLGEEEVHKRLNEQYLPATPHETHADYAGPPNAALDRDIEEWEVRQATRSLNCRSAAGPDRATNKALRNLNDAAVVTLTKYFNECWRSGSLPKQWKKAKTILLPKPNKPPGIENLRPISLTSCVGKVMEHVLNARWQRFLEDNELYPDAMLGFRARLGTQDAMLLLQHEVLALPEGPTADNRAILSLDMQSAFDKVRHSAILAQVSRLGLGRRSYDYIRAFLSRRMARLEVWGTQLEERELGSTGTPQGSVISPLLFNLVTIGVARRLDELPDVRYSIHADDVTLWVTGGSDGHIESTLQEAVRTIEAGLAGTGLRCSPQKSQLLILPPPGRYRKRAAAEAERNIVVRAADGTAIPTVPSIRVLGMHVDANRGNGTTIEKMITKMGIATRLVKRISTRSRGMREASLLRLLQAFVVSHVAYVGAFHQWKAQERERIDAAIRKSYRAALGLLNGTSNAALLSLGVHNTLAEISEAQRVSQLERLGSTTSGRKILQRVGLHPPLGPAAEDELVPLRDDIARRIVVPPLPRNVDPERNVERRSARARALARTYNEDEGAVFVDAVKHRERADTFVAVVLKATSGELLNAGSVRATTARQAEEAAIALALTLPGTRTVLSDSKSAISNFARGTVCRSTARLLSRIREGAANSTSIRWFPAHAGRELPNGHHNRNEEADAAARVLATCRTAPPRLDRTSEDSGEEADDDHDEDAGEPLVAYGEVLRWYRRERGTFPPPHPSLSREEAVLLRQLQTETVLTPALARHVCPELYERTECCVCARVPADLAHIMWGCDEQCARDGGDRLPPDIGELIGSPEHGNQLRAVQRLEAALAQQRRKESQRPSPPGPRGGRADGDGAGDPSNPRGRPGTTPRAPPAT